MFVYNQVRCLISAECVCVGVNAVCVCVYNPNTLTHTHIHLELFRALLSPPLNLLLVIVSLLCMRFGTHIPHTYAHHTHAA